MRNLMKLQLCPGQWVLTGQSCALCSQQLFAIQPWHHAGAEEGLGVVSTDTHRTIWDKQAEPLQGGHALLPSMLPQQHCRVPCLTWSEGRRCRWTRSPSLCSRWGAAPAPRPSHGPFCSGGKMDREGGKHRTVTTTTPQNFHVKDLGQLFTKNLSSSAQYSWNKIMSPNKTLLGRGKSSGTQMRVVPALWAHSAQSRSFLRTVTAPDTVIQEDKHDK